MEEFCLKKSIFYVDFFLVLFEPVNLYVFKIQIVFIWGHKELLFGFFVF